jgi:hypothetical protein
VAGPSRYGLAVALARNGATLLVGGRVGSHGVVAAYTRTFDGRDAVGQTVAAPPDSGATALAASADALCGSGRSWLSSGR